MMGVMLTSDYLWQRNHPLSALLWPLSLLFAMVAALRRWLYRNGLLRSKKLSAPVIVVGNITLGGSGKTPLVIWMARCLCELGYKPGVVLRGYGGQARSWPQTVTAASEPLQVGDEAVLIARRTGLPVAVAPKRVEAAALLLEQGCNLILADDGLQHYALKRDLEIAVLDAKRRFGNGLQLPAGPLREPLSRLNTVDAVVATGNEDIVRPQTSWFIAFRHANEAVNLMTGERRALSTFRGTGIYAVAGTGNPKDFFSLLQAAGLRIEAKTFPDHHVFRAEDLDFDYNLPILMTEKDAVKCFHFSDPRYWYLKLELEPEEQFSYWLKMNIARLIEEHHEQKTT